MTRPVLHHGQATPSRRKAKPVTRRVHPSINTTTKQKLHALDSGRCLITFEKRPTASQQVVHILSHKTSSAMLKNLEMMWQTSPLNLDSINNLVTLRADWCLSFEQGDWALVPAEHLLRKILESDAASNFDEPYPEFSLDNLHDYVFVPLPTLQEHYILRQMTKFDEDEGEDDGEIEDYGESEVDGENDGGSEDESEDDGGSEDDSEDNDESEDESEDDGDDDGEIDDDGDDDDEGDDEGDDENMDGEVGSEVKQDTVNIENGNATVHIKPFSGFPLLKHHAHPFFVIYNALQKLRRHMLLLRPEHFHLFYLMNDINIIWMSRLYGALIPSKLNKRRRSSDDALDDRPKRKTKGTPNSKCGNFQLPVADRTKTCETHRRDGAGEGKGKARGPGETTPAKQPSSSSTLQSSTERPKDFLFDDTSEVTAWSAAVAAAGTPEDMDETVVWSDEERVRPPIKNWDRWRDPYKQPKQRARFCSSDWPMYYHSFSLWTSRPYKG